jgi:hypothetical protein
LLAPSAYPALDVIVSTDSPEVKQWILDVNNSGVAIPSIAPTVAGKYWPWENNDSTAL